MVAPDKRLVPVRGGPLATGLESIWLRYQQAPLGWHVVIPAGLGVFAGIAITWAWTVLDQEEFGAAVLLLLFFLIIGIGASLAIVKRWLRIIVLGVVVGITIYSAAIIWQKKGDKPLTTLWTLPAPTPKPMLRCVMAIDSRVMSRLYTDVFSLRPALDEAEWDEPVKYQEVFYEWAVMITPEQHVPNLSITIDHLSLSDRLNVVPEDGTVTEPAPRWVTGHSDPSSDPHYYARTIRFTDLSQNRVAKIAILRPRKTG